MLKNTIRFEPGSIEYQNLHPAVGGGAAAGKTEGAGFLNDEADAFGGGPPLLTAADPSPLMVILPTVGDCWYGRTRKSGRE